MTGNPNLVSPFVADTADVDDRAVLGEGVKVWHLAQVREHARIGAGSTLGRGAYVGPGVSLGENCKVQNYALIYEPAVLEDGVFVGPSVVFTNDVYPRAINPDGSLKSADDWSSVGVLVQHGAAIGARAVCIAPVTIGRWALVAAGSVVTRDVPAFAIVAGVPARRVGWVGPAGIALVEEADAAYRCPVTGERYRELDGVLTKE
ncbi:acyltransferase [Salinibacterium sp. ZJ454]|uniref:acyltransferase n=1 Tax=Salinibacterium sp. ZJ454 TaxID=2708339 RepID=UPI001423F9E1|nr:acyltransferase [Salinibacterium sp. ZJ454]